MNTESGSSSMLSIKYTGSGNELAYLMFKNILLTVLTLGLYAPWARTNTRRYIWGKTSFLDDRASYTGQGKELMKGWAFVMMIYFALYALVTVLSSVVTSFAGLLIVALYVYIYALVVYGGTRYRVAKTSWRGVSFGVDKNKESSKEFTRLVFKYAFYSFITMGLLFPLMKHEVRKYLTNKMRLGSTYFTYEANRLEYCKLCYKGVLLSFLTLGLYIPWFAVKLLQFRLENTKLEKATMKLELKGGDLFFYSASSFILSLVTFGLATPWLLNWGNKLVINSIKVTGEIDFSQIVNLVSNGEAAADIAAVEYDIDLAF